ncbi:TetR/AcrR family transcriptional regulator [Variovorax paradoxus]|uniref:TetR/AcrR family transcriptional regulator n=1 Tax=Variovorax paradoxus TaxID=34073 RepID=UPI001ABCEA7C
MAGKKVIHPNEAEAGQNRRAQVLEAAAVCFSKDGFHGTSIQKISEAAGMSPGHIYHYFQNKEAIIHALIQQNLGRAFEHLSHIEERSRVAGPADALVEEMRHAVRTRTDPRHVPLELEILAESARNRSVAKFFQRADRAIYEKIEGVVTAIPSSRGLSAAELEATIDVIVAMSDGLVFRAVGNPKMNKEEVGKVMQRVVRFLVEDQKS